MLIFRVHDFRYSTLYSTLPGGTSVSTFLSTIYSTIYGTITATQTVPTTIREISTQLGPTLVSTERYNQTVPTTIREISTQLTTEREVSTQAGPTVVSTERYNQTVPTTIREVSTQLAQTIVTTERFTEPASTVMRRRQPESGEQTCGRNGLGDQASEDKRHSSHLLPGSCSFCSGPVASNPVVSNPIQRFKYVRKLGAEPCHQPRVPQMSLCCKTILPHSLRTRSSTSIHQSSFPNRYAYFGADVPSQEY